MKLYIIGICGTFMGGIARLARDMEIDVSGSDANTYPPMSTQLESLGIKLYEGYRSENIPEDVDLVLVGNTISRGNPELEYVLDRGLNYTSGAQWLSQQVLRQRWVLAIAGTHGKTTTSSILTWILEYNDLKPGFLIGGVPENFGESARLGDSIFFVIEADEYDTAFSDKRSKFVHYHPRTLVLNNLEFDHADIFKDLEAIQTQFHHLLKIVPESGKVISNVHSPALDQVLDKGLWSKSSKFGLVSSDSQWKAEKTNADASQFNIVYEGETFPVKWPLIGEHNMLNALAAIAAAHHAGVKIEDACAALESFKSVKRRLEKIHEDSKFHVYDDFAHHPTAITETLAALRAQVKDEPIIAILEPRSNTMRRGIHKDKLADSLTLADFSLIFADETVQWDIQNLASSIVKTFGSIDLLIEQALNQAKLLQNQQTCHILIMSNGGFGGLHERIIEQIKA